MQSPERGSNLPFIEQDFKQLIFARDQGRELVWTLNYLIKISLLDIDFVCVKGPIFSFTRLRGADPTLGVEM
jgi:carbamoyl-phosphate synthase/aspartate carbamoyltransferase